MINEKKTLIFRFSSMGDVVMTVPIIRCLEKKYPENKFIFVTRPKFKPFFEEFKNLPNRISNFNSLLDTWYDGYDKLK